MDTGSLPTTRPVRIPGVDEVEVSDGLLLHHRGELFRLDSVGAVLWESLDGTVTVEELGMDIEAAISGLTDGATRVARFVGALREHGLVSI